MKEFIAILRREIRGILRQAAAWIDRATDGKVTANAITIFGLLMHLPLAILVARGRLIWAGILLVVLSMFYMLDGELARLQKRTGNVGHLLAATAGRFREVMLYTGAAYFLAHSTRPGTVVWAVVACGASLSVSYIKARGESMVAMKGRQLTYTTLNNMFAGGMLPFEVRMLVLTLGLLTNQLLFAVMSVAVLASLTAFQRLITISERLRA